jgi:hypothetical protein
MPEVELHSIQEQCCAMLLSMNHLAHVQEMARTLLETVRSFFCFFVFFFFVINNYIDSAQNILLLVFNTHVI